MHKFISTTTIVFLLVAIAVELLFRPQSTTDNLLTVVVALLAARVSQEMEREK